MRAFCGNGHTTFIIRLRLTGKDTFYFAELAAHFIHHVRSGTTYGIHCQATEQESHHTAKKHSRKHFRIHQRYIIMVHEIEEGGILHRYRLTAHSNVGSTQTRQSDTNLFYVGRKQGESRQRGRADGKPLTRSGCCITQRIERIGTLAHFLAQTGHFGIATGIVGNRSISIRSQRYS